MVQTSLYSCVFKKTQLKTQLKNAFFVAKKISGCEINEKIYSLDDKVGYHYSY